MKTRFLTRLLALAASAAVTFSVVVGIADYALPESSVLQLLAAASDTVTR